MRRFAVFVAHGDSRRAVGAAAGRLFCENGLGDLSRVAAFNNNGDTVRRDTALVRFVRVVFISGTARHAGKPGYGPLGRFKRRL